LAKTLRGNKDKVKDDGNHKVEQLNCPKLIKSLCPKRLTDNKGINGYEDSDTNGKPKGNLNAFLTASAFKNSGVTYSKTLIVVERQLQLHISNIGTPGYSNITPTKTFSF
jgi:hypothetical protein